MKYGELKDLTAEELRQKEAGFREELFKLRLRQATSRWRIPRGFGSCGATSPGCDAQRP